MILLYAVRAGIVRSQSFDGVVVILVKQRAQVRRAGIDVGLVIDRISHTELRRGSGRQAVATTEQVLTSAACRDARR